MYSWEKSEELRREGQNQFFLNLFSSLGRENAHQRRRTVSWKSSSGYGRLRSNGSACGQEDIMMPSSSTTEEEDPQSLWQSPSPFSGRGGAGGLVCRLCSGCRRRIGTEEDGSLGPLDDSTVLLWLLEIGR